MDNQLISTGLSLFLKILFDCFSLGLVFFELFAGNLAPFWNMKTQTLTLPKSYKGQSIVQPCIVANPAQRPTATQVTQFLDHLINKIVLSVKNSMSPIEQEQLKQGNQLASNNRFFFRMSTREYNTQDHSTV